MVFLELHDVLIFPSTAFAEMQDMLNSFFICISMSAFMPIHYMDLHASSLNFLIPI